MNSKLVKGELRMTLNNEAISRKDRALGMLWGLHCGDSLGATLEFGPPSISPLYHNNIIGLGPFNWTPGAATDDTDLMLFVFKALKHKGTFFDFEDLKASLLAWADSKPKDIGNTTKKGIENLRLGLPYRECGYKHPTMYGNGSIMRAAPLALYTGSDLSEVVQTQCLMTHGHEICVEIDLIYIQILKKLLAGIEVKEVLKTLFIDLEKKAEKAALFQEILGILKTNAESPWDSLNTSGHAVWTLGAGIWALNQCHQGLKPDKALIMVANRGDDSDTCAAVAGALLGGAYGYQVWPEEWLQILEKRQQIKALLEQVL